MQNISIEQHNGAGKWKLVSLHCLNINSTMQLRGNRIAEWRSILELELELELDGEGRETDEWQYG